MDTSVLLTSELVTNVVLHARTALDLSVTRLDDELRIDVSDSSPDRPQLGTVIGRATTGRGLLLLDRLAATWGTADKPAEQGKTVWFTLPIDAPAAVEDNDAPEDLAAWGDLGLALELGLDVFPDRPTTSPTEGVVPQEAVEDPPGSAVIRLPPSPVHLWLRSRVHLDELVRELTLLAVDGTDPDSEVFEALATAYDRLRSRHSAVIEHVSGEIQTALSTGEDVIEVEFAVPPREAAAVAEELVAFADTLLRARRACARRQALLTLESSAETEEFRRHIGTELLRQLRSVAAAP